METKKDNIFYDTADIDSNNFFLKNVNSTAYKSIVDSSGEELFVLQVGLNPKIIYGSYIALLIVCGIIFSITLTISKLAFFGLSGSIIKPLSELDKKMSQISEGDIESTIYNEIKFEKPVIEVVSLANSANKIMSKMHEYMQTLAQQNEELEHQNSTLQENSVVLENTNKILDNKNLKLTNILSNVEQGILTFKENLIIHNEYSLVCKEIFSECISDKKLSTILHPDDTKMQLFIDDLLIKIFSLDKEQQGIYLTLLPEEIVINNRSISLDYKIVKDETNEDTIMTIITDVTEKKLLEKQRDKEHDTLKMVVKTILNRDDFRELVFEFEDFASQSFDNLPKEKYEEILREIHTFKGSFSQYEMVNLISKLDDLESKLYEKNDLFHVKDIDNSQLHEWLMEDLGIIEAYAGEDFIKDEEFCYIKKEKLVEIERKVAETLSSKEARVILPLIKSLRYKSLKELLKTYPDYVIKLSERLGKNVAPFDITGDDIMVDSNYYQDVLKSLVHIFRNSVDHGIETDDVRIENNKEEIANIRCNIVDLEDSFSIEILDDGKGIDLKALETKVVSEGLFTTEGFNKLKLNEKLELIYKQGITTKEKATYVSGRGVGMAAVKQTIENYNGRIEVESIQNKGTKFTITIPKVEEKENNVVTAEHFMEQVMKTSKHIIFKETNMEFKENPIEINDRVTLNKITALISLKGDFNSIMMVSVNEKMAKEFVKGFMIDNIEESVILEYVEDVLGEISNTILGSTFGKFENTNSKFYMGLPAVLSNSDGYIKHAQSEILSFRLKHDEYEFEIHMFLVNDDVNTNYQMEDIIDG